MQLDVIHRPDELEFIATINGTTVGRLRYREDSPGGWTMYSTVVDSDKSGQGVGTELVRVAVESARSQGKAINPTCWFVAEWLDRNPVTD